MRFSSETLFYFFRQAVLLALIVASSGCSFFSGPPALPRPAAIETRAMPRADARFAALVENADIIYFPTELLGSEPLPGPASRLMEALKASGNSFAIGWDFIAVEEQTFLQQWANGEISTDGLLSRLDLPGTERGREKYRALLVEGKKWRARFLALRPPGASRDEVGFAADRIVGQFREHRDEKLLVFLGRRHLETTGGVPYFVAQKIKARQLVLDSRPDRASRSQLLAWGRRNWDGDWGRGGCRGSGSGGRGLLGRFEIVDASPRTGGDRF